MKRGWCWQRKGSGIVSYILSFLEQCLQQVLSEKAVVGHRLHSKWRFPVSARTLGNFFPKIWEKLNLLKAEFTLFRENYNKIQCKLNAWYELPIRLPLKKENQTKNHDNGFCLPKGAHQLQRSSLCACSVPQRVEPIGLVHNLEIREENNI